MQKSSLLKRLSGTAMGILAGIGGFVDTGGIVSATKAGAEFGYGLVWTILFGYMGFAIFAEMSGRIAISSSQPTYEVIRTRLGPRLGAIPVITNVLVHILTLAVDFAGMALALAALTHLHYRICVPFLALGLATALWLFDFERIDTIAATLGVTMLVSVAAMIRLPQHWPELAFSFFHPSISAHHSIPAYLFAAAAMLGAFMTPYQFDFYSSGAVEANWTGKDLRENRFVSMIGTLFGALVALGLMTAARTALASGSGSLDTLGAAARPAIAAFGTVGFYIFFIGVFFVSLAASVELCLSGGYAVCQYYGWDWGKSMAPAAAPAFNAIFLLQIVLAAAIVLTGVDAIRFSILTMVLAAAALPFTFVPLLLIANDKQFMGEQANSLAQNVAALLVTAVLTGVTLAAPGLLVISHGGF